jgi:hypothetical protein
MLEGSAAQLPNDSATYFRPDHRKTVRIELNDATNKSHGIESSENSIRLDGERLGKKEDEGKGRGIGHQHMKDRSISVQSQRGSYIA